MTQIAAGPHGGRPGERALVVAPLSHAGAVWSALAPLAWGAGLVIAESTAPADLVRALDELRIGYAALVPAVLAPMADVPGRRGPRLPGAAPAAHRLGPGEGADPAPGDRGVPLRVVQGYGLTETAAAVSTMTPADTALALCTRPDLLGSVGRALRGTRIRVVDAGGRPVPRGTRRRGRRPRSAADDRLRRAPRRDARRAAARMAAHR